MRDDFPIDVKRTLALRVRHTCSNPDCLAPTAGPHDDPSGTVNIGVAAHITAAASGGKRFDPNLTPEQRGSIDNGIWLCQNCAKLIDSDLSRFTEALLRAWKLVAEDRARLSLGKTSPSERIIESPILELVLELDGIGPDTYTQMPVRRFLLGLKNTGKAMAKFPGIRFDRALGLSVDPFGIDGNFGFGLPQSPSQQAVIGFRGGNDHVIHIDEGLTIGRLLQQGDNKGVEGIKVATIRTSIGQMVLRIIGGNSKPSTSVVRFRPRELQLRWPRRNSRLSRSSGRAVSSRGEMAYTAWAIL